MEIGIKSKKVLKYGKTLSEGHQIRLRNKYLKHENKIMDFEIFLIKYYKKEIKI